jgi:predicted kinase
MKDSHDLVLLRGVSGAGKTTLAKMISIANEVAADDYFDEFCGGEFDPAKLKAAHEWCQKYTEGLMGHGATPVVIHNTFTRDWEMDAYYALAKKYGYRVHTMIVENRHGSKSVHGVPEDKVEQMKDRFEIKL